MKKIIGIAGKFGTGKTMVSNYLGEKFGFSIYENSDVLKKEASLRGIYPTRENLIDIAVSWHEKYGKQIIVEKLLNGIEGDGIISGIRLLEQAKYLKENADFTLIYIESQDETIFQRVVERGKYGEPVGREEFERLSKKDWQSDLPKLKENADFVLENNETKEDAFKRLDIFIQTYFKS